MWLKTRKKCILGKNIICKVVMVREGRELDVTGVYTLEGERVQMGVLVAFGDQRHSEVPYIQAVGRSAKGFKLKMIVIYRSYYFSSLDVSWLRMESRGNKHE